ncbi:HigA family addiction module antidote protein [Sphingobium yanoikuyae]|uniref:HigA family addiction module antidote protein n=1 Tax=Sphingobium yanoikuyae TaxID=13690 RepID=A0A6P1GM63_SPHYA|nr:HigA family addiction module antitoxin [Sphingobium yanoikuyae]QHD69528.1 HigA family addiction module antidote protein [Sphingobium yanoikuyae]
MMHNPPHPGELLRDEIIVALDLSVTEAANRLALSRTALSRILNGRAAISPDLAVRLEQAGAGTARAWLTMQTNYDLWHAMQHKQPPVRHLQDAA